MAFFGFQVQDHAGTAVMVDDLDIVTVWPISNIFKSDEHNAERTALQKQHSQRIHNIMSAALTGESPCMEDGGTIADAFEAAVNSVNACIEASRERGQLDGGVSLSLQDMHAALEQFYELAKGTRAT